MAEMLLELRHVRHSHAGKAVLQDVSLQLRRGEILALIGENGAGKSTLLSIAANARAVQGGQRQYARPMPRIAWLGDKPALYPDWTVEMLVYCSADCRGTGAAKAAAAAAVEACGLQPVLRSRCKHLSHGFRQRAALAAALAGQPDILCLDEPGNGLDMQQKLALRGILRRSAARTGILLVHHDLEEVAAVADRVYALYQGRALALTLPDKDACWLWCEWESLAAAQACDDAQVREGTCSGYRCADEEARAEKMRALATCPGLLRMGFAYPAAALQAQYAALGGKTEEAS